MIKSNNTISRDMLDILRACKGRKVETLLGTDLDWKSSFEVVILRFEEYDLEIWSLEQPNKEGGVPDLAKIFVKGNPDQNCPCTVGKKSKNGVFQPREFTIISINQTINGITVYNELVQWTYEDKNFLLANTYAIVISLGKRFLHITKSAEWSEIWDVSFRRSPVPTPPECDESEKVSYSSIEL